MNQERLLLEYSPGFVLICILVGIGYAYLLYRGKHPWNKTTNQILFALRAVMVFFLAFLLIGPILKLTKNIFEDPVLVVLVDDSASVKEAVNDEKLHQLQTALFGLESELVKEGYEVVYESLSGSELKTSQFENSTSDINGALKRIMEEQEGRNVNGVVLVSDGIYNSGASPLYATYGVPIFSVGLGDTVQRVDVSLKNLFYNKIAYQGNQFPLRAEVLLQGIQNEEVRVSVFQGGKLIQQKQENSGRQQLLNFDFKIEAADKGLQRVDVVVEKINGEANIINNRSSAFVEVVEGKRRFLVVAPAPHPDLKALRSVIEENSNYEFVLHIPGVEEVEANLLKPGKFDLAIFHNVIDQQGRTQSLYKEWEQTEKPIFLILGRRSNLKQFSTYNIPVNFELMGQWDEVTPLINPGFRDFAFSDGVNSTYSRYPPISVPYGKFTHPAQAKILLTQKIGSVETERPLLMVYEVHGTKRAFLFGEGFWRWRLSEFSVKENSEVFDETFSKLLQYLSTPEDKRKFRCFPLQTEFTEGEPVLLESQIYNDLYEPVFGNMIEIEVRDENNKLTRYTYATSPGNSRYRIGELPEGVYKFVASTEINNQREVVRGEFLVRSQFIESQNLTADFSILRKLSFQTGGKFFGSDQIQELQTELAGKELQSRIQSEESFNPIINLKWVFFILLSLVSFEWFTRKYSGGY
ncbi:MAG: hypothetical protein HC811_08890 [Flammeovirgaceae bacterium]|nr:hypothetical protein [Flammeovirgaceae bacterium]